MELGHHQTQARFWVHPRHTQHMLQDAAMLSATVQLSPAATVAECMRATPTHLLFSRVSTARSCFLAAVAAAAAAGGQSGVPGAF
jgi:hypothetical protein